MHRNGVSPVETQNLASPVEPISTHAGNKTLTILDLPTCETQDFASLLFITYVMILRFLLCIAMAPALYVCKILRLMLITRQYPHRHFIIPSFCLIFAHRINCTLGNRKNLSFLSFALLFYISHCSLPRADLQHVVMAATYFYNYELYRLFR